IQEITANFAKDSANGVDFPKNLKVAVADGATAILNWITIYDQAVQSDAQGTTQKLTYTAPEIFKARFIKLTFTQQSTFMGMDEVVITGKGNLTGAVDPIDLVSKNLINLSKGRTYTSSETDVTYPDTNHELTDGVFASGGKTDAAWTGFYFNKRPSKTVEIDFGEIRFINKIAMNFLTDSSNGVALPNTTQFAVSEDGKNWTTVYNSKDAKPTGSTLKHQFFSSEPIKAQYVMFYMYSRNDWTLVDEIEIWGNDKTAPPIDPPTPPVDPEIVKDFALPNAASGNIHNMAVLDIGATEWTADLLKPYTQHLSATGRSLGAMFDGIALTSSTSSYSN
ncbi:MAG: discoidin domain-containing protein, partial [Oscillospiraceae bacterium]